MSLQPDQLALQPKSFPVERVRVDFRKLLSSLGQALTHGTFALFAPDPATASGSAVNAAAAVFGSVEAFEADAPLEVRAWYLVRASLADALSKLLGELHERKGPFAGDLKHLDNRFDLLLDGPDAVIDAQFLDNPRTLKLLPKLRQTLEGWLSTNVGLSEGEARSLAARLDSYLAPALRAESRAHREYYRPVIDHFEDRFAYAAQMEWDWERNRLELICQMDQPVFEETFSLRQIYVPLRSYYLEEIETEDPVDEMPKRRCVVRLLHEQIDYWLSSAAKEADDIRLITGGPGSGKSTFAKWLATELSETRRLRTLFFPLQRFRVTAGLKDAIGGYLRTTGRFRQNPLAQDGFANASDPLLLIFDGLDELTKPGDFADEQARLFIEELRHNLGLWNEGEIKVLALITGRTVYAQAKRSLLRISSWQELSVLPYLVDGKKIDELCSHDCLDGKDLLDEDQRAEWWRNYGSAKGFGDPALPGIFRSNSDLRELTAEPLLNYLVVLSGFHQDVEARAEVNRNRIYARLLKDVLDRRHAKRARADDVALGAVQDVDDRPKVERLLETIAVAAWYGDGRTTTLAEIEKLLPSDLEPIWQELLVGGPGFTRLIAAFYIRQAESSARTDAIEFTHKSFGEYLTGRRLVREVEEIHDSLRQGRRYTLDDALADWARLTGAQAMTMDLLRFARDEIALKSEGQIRRWQEALTELLARELRQGFPLSAVGSNGFREAERHARNAEEALLAALNACARITHQVSDVSWFQPTSAGELINRLRGQREVIGRKHVAYSSLSYLDMTQQSFIYQELINTDLDFSVLHYANLHGAMILAASFVKADLTNARIDWARVCGGNFQNAKLTGTSLRHADLSTLLAQEPRRTILCDADLRRADLRDANLRGANLRSADLRDADLRDADLRGAELHEVNLRQADLRGADLRGADLRNASIHGAKLRGTSLCSANLQGSELQGADLREADLREADLRGANLRGANVRGANLRGANLRGTNLRGANLREVDLNGADLNNADLRGAKNLTKKQIGSAHDVTYEKLPNYIKT